MYLALYPDAAHTAAIHNAIASHTLDSYHLTVIHSLSVLPAALARGVVALKPFDVPVLGFERMGSPLNPVQALRLAATPELREIRAQAEASMRAAGIMWSRQWPFSPHITLLRSRRPIIWQPMKFITFNRMEWRQ
jgi:2'-5' RNA ligase